MSEVVADNIDTIRGVGPWMLRRRRDRRWLRNTAMVAVPLFAFVFSYFASTLTGGPRSESAPPQTLAVIVPAAAPEARPAPAQPATFAAPKPMDPAAIPLEIHRIVIDAGHGGNDPGTTAPDRLAEKDVTLDIALRLKALLEQASFTVATTRGTDQTLPLKDRAHIANASAADIFVSIHVNSIHSTKSRGVETYYLGPTNDPELTRLAASENGGSGYSLADFKKLLERIYADVRQDESRRLAESVQGEMLRTLHGVNPVLENWGVRRAPFVVLVATDMPAILAEVSCMSNDEEARLLGRPEYRQKIAEALYHGIRDYAVAHNSPKQKGS